MMPQNLRNDVELVKVSADAGSWVNAISGSNFQNGNDDRRRTFLKYPSDWPVFKYWPGTFNYFWND